MWIGRAEQGLNYEMTGIGVEFGVLGLGELDSDIHQARLNLKLTTRVGMGGWLEGVNGPKWPLWVSNPHFSALPVKSQAGQEIRVKLISIPA